MVVAGVAAFAIIKEIITSDYLAGKVICAIDDDLAKEVAISKV